MDQSYTARNSQSLQRLRRIIRRLSNDDFDRSIGHGWTVSAALAHLAFWDQRAQQTLDRWQRDGTLPSSSDADSINAAELGHWLALPGHEAASWALASAEEIDRQIANAPGELADAMLAAGRPRTLDRSLHRHEHIDEIERALGRGNQGG